MNEKEMRLNMIKLFAIGVKYANAVISDDDFAYTDIIDDFFDKDGEPATIEEIFNKLSKFNVSRIEECRKTKNVANKIRNNDELIGIIKDKLDYVIEISKEMDGKI